MRNVTPTVGGGGAGPADTPASRLTLACHGRYFLLMHTFTGSKRLFAGIGVALGLVVSSAPAVAGPKGDHHEGHGSRVSRAVPEINATHAGAALVLVIGGAAVVLGRRRKVG